MYELLNFVVSELESSSSDWTDEFYSFLTSYILSSIDDFFASLSLIGGRSDV